MQQDYLFLEAFRKKNKITQQDLADFLGVSRGFVSLVESGKSKLPEDKIDMIMREGRLDQKWDVSTLNPLYYRLYELAEDFSNRQDPRPQIVFDWETGQSLFPITPLAMLDIKHGKEGFSYELMHKVRFVTPYVNYHWLKFGAGSMYIPYDKENVIRVDRVLDAEEVAERYRQHSEESGKTITPFEDHDPYEQLYRDEHVDSNDSPESKILLKLVAIDARLAAIETRSAAIEKRLAAIEAKLGK